MRPTIGLALASSIFQLFTGCATAPLPIPLSATELGFVCDILRDTGASGMMMNGLDGTSDDETLQRIEGVAQTWRWKELPPRLLCEQGKVTLRPRGYGEFITGFAMSDDGRYAGLGGGYQLAALFGGGGYCVFRRELESWRVEGCVHEWDS